MSAFHETPAPDPKLAPVNCVTFPENEPVATAVTDTDKGLFAGLPDQIKYSPPFVPVPTHNVSSPCFPAITFISIVPSWCLIVAIISKSVLVFDIS